MTAKGDGSRIKVSYLTLRRLVGCLGITLPFLLAIGCIAYSACCVGVMDSVSAYYYSSMRNIFVGVLFAIGFFMFSYKGYDSRDDVAGDLACLFTLGVALFPTSNPAGPIGSSNNSIAAIHYSSAALLFTILGYFSIFLFTKTDANTNVFHWPRISRKFLENSGITEGKIGRNRIYVACGLIIIVCMVLIGIYAWFLEATWLASLNPIFWLESVMLLAFGFSWFVKGETLWRDPPPTSVCGEEC